MRARGQVSCKKDFFVLAEFLACFPLCLLYVVGKIREAHYHGIKFSGIRLGTEEIHFFNNKVLDLLQIGNDRLIDLNHVNFHSVFLCDR